MDHPGASVGPPGSRSRCSRSGGLRTAAAPGGSRVARTGSGAAKPGAAKPGAARSGAAGAGATGAGRLFSAVLDPAAAASRPGVDVWSSGTARPARMTGAVTSRQTARSTVVL
jgi:hypothetical protein